VGHCVSNCPENKKKMYKNENFGKKEIIHSGEKDEWKGRRTRRVAPGRSSTRGTNPLSVHMVNASLSSTYT
jgi:hypothetical protein